MTEANSTGNNAGNNANVGSSHSRKERPAPKRPPLNLRMRTGDAAREEKATGRSRRSRRRSGTNRNSVSSKRAENKNAEARSAVSKAPRTRSSAFRVDARGDMSKGQTKGQTKGPIGSQRRIPTKGNSASGAIVKSTMSKPEIKTGGKLVPLKNSSLARRRTHRRKMPVPLLYLSRLAVVGLGIAAIGGTLLRALPSSDAQTAETAAPAAEVEEPTGASFPVPLNQELASLKAEMQELPNLYPDLTPKAFYIDVDTGNYVNLEGGDVVAAASTIKLPVLLAFFEEVDAGRITFEQTIELLPEHIAGGSGDMQLAAPGTRFTALEVASQMIVTSDNTATSMMIDLLGGPIALNERFVSYGLEKTQLNAPLPDVEGTNKTSAKDLVHTMLMISSDRLSMHSRDRILNILNRTHNKALLADGLMAKEALTYNKTGYIGIMLGDVALVDLANGKRYVVAAMVERPMNDNRATELIHRISDMTYKASDEAIQPAVTPLGNPEGEAPVTAPATGAAANVEENAATEDGDGATGATEAAENSDGVEITPIEEDPYPSANP